MGVVTVKSEIRGFPFRLRFRLWREETIVKAQRFWRLRRWNLRRWLADYQSATAELEAMRERMQRKLDEAILLGDPGGTA